MATSKSVSAKKSNSKRIRLTRKSAYSFKRSVPLVWAGVFFLLLGAYFRVTEPTALIQLRNIAFDSFQKWHPRTFDPDLPVRIVAIDDASLDRIGQWPWPRHRMAELVDKLNASGAAAIAVDFVFSEPDRMSGDQVARLLPQGPEREQARKALAGLPDGDARFAQAIARSRSVLGVVLTNGETLGDIALISQDKAGFAFAGDSPEKFVPSYETAVQPLQSLGQASTGLGALNWVPSVDLVVREVPLLFRVGDVGLAPSLAAEALRVAQGSGTYVVRSSNASGQSSFDEQTGINTVRIGHFDIPTTPSGAILMHFSPSHPDRMIPAWQVLSGEVPVDEVAGRIILIGATAPGLFDLQATPIDPSITGIEINAQVIEHVLTQTFLKRPDWALGAEFVAFATMVILFTVIAAVFTPFVTVLLGGLTLSAVVGVSYLLFVRNGLFIDPSFSVLGSSVMLFGATSFLAVRERADRRWVRSAFGHYVSDDLVQQIVRDQDSLSLGGELRTMTVLFSDIRNFSTLAEGMDAQELTGFVNAFLTDLTEAITASGGTIDKYIGDAVMAFWNAPLEDDDHAAHACQAALDMVSALQAFNMRNAKRFPRTQIGIGINTGVCCVGNLGSKQRFDYSVIGDEVNVGARLESATKTYGIPILVGLETSQKAGDQFVFAPVDYVRVKGKDEPTDILALLGGPDHPVDDVTLCAIEPVSQMVTGFKKNDWAAVEHSFNAAQEIGAPAFGRVLDLYRDRLAKRSMSENAVSQVAKS